MLQDSFQSVMANFQLVMANFQLVMVITLQLNVNVARNVALVGNTLMSVMTIALEMKFLLWFESSHIRACTIPAANTWSVAY